MKAGTKSPITEVFWFLHFLCVEKVKKERFGLAEKTGRGIDRFFEDSIIFGRPWQNSSGKDTKNRQCLVYPGAGGFFTDFRLWG